MNVIDASVLANVIGDDDAAGATARAALMGQEISAPDLVDVDTVSVLRRRWRSGTLTVSRFAVAIDEVSTLPADRYPVLPFMHRAYQLRDNVTAYDATYVALAEQLGCLLVTADQRLANSPGIQCRIRLLLG